MKSFLRIIGNLIMCSLLNHTCAYGENNTLRVNQIEIDQVSADIQNRTLQQESLERDLQAATREYAAYPDRLYLYGQKDRFRLLLERMAYAQMVDQARLHRLITEHKQLSEEQAQRAFDDAWEHAVKRV